MTRLAARLRLIRRVIPMTWSWHDSVRVVWSLFSDKLFAKNRGYSAVFKLRGQKVTFHYPSASELYTLLQVFVNEDYKSAAEDPKRIVDLGANVGLASLYFLLSYPNASLEAYEPDPVTAGYLRLNLQPFPRARVIERAVASRRGTIEFYRNIRSCASSIYPTEGEFERVQVEAVALDDILAGGVDVLKVDVEGAEKEIFSNATKLGSVGELIIECDGEDKEATRGLLKEHFTVTERSGILHAASLPA